MRAAWGPRDLVAIGLDLQVKLRAELSPDRFLHTLRVARTAGLLAPSLGIDRERAWLGGLVHDWAREWSHHDAVNFLENHRSAISEDERKRPVLLHGRIAALLLSRTYDFQDGEIAEAVSHHTLGKAGMGPLAKLLYVADYLEPGRRFTSPPFRHQVRAACLDCMVRLVIEHNLGRHGDLHLLTKQLYDEARGRCATGICREWRWQGHE